MMILSRENYFRLLVKKRQPACTAIRRDVPVTASQDTVIYPCHPPLVSILLLDPAMWDKCVSVCQRQVAMIWKCVTTRPRRAII